MSLEENKRIARDFFVLATEGDIEGAMALMADDGICWIPTDRLGGLTVNKQMLRAMEYRVHGIFDRIPRIEVGRLTAEDDRVCVEMALRGGTTKGGNTYDNDYHMLVRIGDGQIVEVFEYLNPALVRSIGAELQAAANREKAAGGESA